MASDVEHHGAPPREGRGLGASRPRRIPLRGWKDIVVRVYKELDHDQVSVLAAGVAFFAFLGIVPALTALGSLYGLFLNPEEVNRQIAALGGVLPEEARTLLTQQLLGLAKTSGLELSFGAMFGFGFALWSSSRAMRTLMQALNLVYDLPKPRGVVRLYATSLLLTFGAILLTIVMLGVIVVVPLVLSYVGLAPDQQTLVSAIRWPVLAIFVFSGLSVIYRIGPNRRRPGWRWVIWGAVIATILWLGASWLFSWYISGFGQYEKTWGSIGAIVVFQLWLFLSAFVVLLGAEINSEVEHQTEPAGQG
ncbi:MAG: YihY/virulence factor BrkB family protein [Myxococcota bacterium]